MNFFRKRSLKDGGGSFLLIHSLCVSPSCCLFPFSRNQHLRSRFLRLLPVTPDWEGRTVPHPLPPWLSWVQSTVGLPYTPSVSDAPQNWTDTARRAPVFDSNLSAAINTGGSEGLVLSISVW